MALSRTCRRRNPAPSPWGSRLYRLLQGVSPLISFCRNLSPRGGRKHFPVSRSPIAEQIAFLPRTDATKPAGFKMFTNGSLSYGALDIGGREEIGSLYGLSLTLWRRMQDSHREPLSAATASVSPRATKPASVEFDHQRVGCLIEAREGVEHTDAGPCRPFGTFEAQHNVHRAGEGRRTAAGVPTSPPPFRS